MKRASLASEFVSHPYWALICQMLTGTTLNEFEAMLESDDKLALHRASVVICRRVMRMPFIDIEQGQRAVQLEERFGVRKREQGVYRAFDGSTRSV